MIRSLPENERINSFLDLGCGAGMIGLTLAGVPEGIVGQAAEQAGFKVENRTLLLSTGTHDINILRK